MFKRFDLGCKGSAKNRFTEKNANIFVFLPELKGQ